MSIQRFNAMIWMGHDDPDAPRIEMRLSDSGTLVKYDDHAAELAELRQAAEAYRDLATCYRVGKSPSEALHKRLGKAARTMEAGQ